MRLGARIATRLLLLVAITGFLPPVHALVLIEQGLRVNGLWVFPQYANPDVYVYLPNRAQLVNDAEGDPRFSFTFFVNDEPSTQADNSLESIVTADGGAILHFLVNYDAQEDQVFEAEQQLQELLDNESIQLRSPIVFDSGRYTVISSVLSGETEQSVALVNGLAPVLAGNQLALSFRLNAEDASILLGTMKSDTPDLSVAFELDFAGLTEAYNARMRVDWSKTQESLAASVGGSLYLVSADARMAIDSLVTDQAVQLEVDGDDAAMEVLLQHVYDKTLEMLFAPVVSEQLPEEQRPGLVQAIGAAIGALSGSEQSNGSVLPFSINATYQRKELSVEGESVLSFHKRAKVTRRSMVSANIGDLYQRYKDDAGRFGVIRIGGDPVFMQRHIYVGIDGGLVPEFDDMVDAVQVTLRKQHPDESETLRELRVTHVEVNEEQMFGPMVYGNTAAEPTDTWREYDYQTQWHLKNGGRYVSPWQTSTAATLIISAPYHRATVLIDGNSQVLDDSSVRALSVNVSTELFGQRRPTRRTYRAGQELALQPVQLILPQGQYSYDYSIDWILDSGERLRRCATDDFGIIFVDDLPTISAPTRCEF